MKGWALPSLGVWMWASWARQCAHWAYQALSHNLPSSLSFLIIILYQQPIERKPKKFNPLVIPKSLKAALPFVTNSKDTPSRKRPLLENRKPAVVMEPDEQKVHALVQHLQLIRSERYGLLDWNTVFSWHFETQA